MEQDDPKASFVRWQSITISQLTYAVNLILGLAVATLGFEVTLLLNREITPVSWQRCTFGLTLVLLAASVFFGIWVVVNRLRDFRITARVARMKMRKNSASEEITIEQLSATSEKLGNRTWWLFWCQIGTFSGGVAFLILIVLALVRDKLV